MKNCQFFITPVPYHGPKLYKKKNKWLTSVKSEKAVNVSANWVFFYVISIHYEIDKKLPVQRLSTLLYSSEKNKAKENEKFISASTTDPKIYD